MYEDKLKVELWIKPKSAIATGDEIFVDHGEDTLNYFVNEKMMMQVHGMLQSMKQVYINGGIRILKL